jgi:hypothetical protein
LSNRPDLKHETEVKIEVTDAEDGARRLEALEPSPRPAPLRGQSPF